MNKDLASQINTEGCQFFTVPDSSPDARRNTVDLTSDLIPDDGFRKVKSAVNFIRKYPNGSDKFVLSNDVILLVVGK